MAAQSHSQRCSIPARPPRSSRRTSATQHSRRASELQSTGQDTSSRRALLQSSSSLRPPSTVIETVPVRTASTPEQEPETTQSRATKPVYLVIDHEGIFSLQNNTLGDNKRPASATTDSDAVQQQSTGVYRDGLNSKIVLWRHSTSADLRSEGKIGGSASHRASIAFEGEVPNAQLGPAEHKTNFWVMLPLKSCDANVEALHHMPMRPDADIVHGTPRGNEPGVPLDSPLPTSTSPDTSSDDTIAAVDETGLYRDKSAPLAKHPRDSLQDPSRANLDLRSNSDDPTTNHDDSVQACLPASSLSIASLTETDCFQSADEGDSDSRRPSISALSATQAAHVDLTASTERQESSFTQDVIDQMVVSNLQDQNPKPRELVQMQESAGATERPRRRHTVCARSHAGHVNDRLQSVGDYPNASAIREVQDAPGAASLYSRHSTIYVKHDVGRRTRTITGPSQYCTTSPEISISYGKAESESVQTRTHAGVWRLPNSQAPLSSSDGHDSSVSDAWRAYMQRTTLPNRRRKITSFVSSSIAEEPDSHQSTTVRTPSAASSIDASMLRHSTELEHKSAKSTDRQKRRLVNFMAAMSIVFLEPPSHISWRSQLPDATYRSLLSQWGPQEMHRQQVLWELCETERSFLQAISSVQKTFAWPLRTPEGRWIKGIPTLVARLFDWLQDILQLHWEIYSTLRRARRQQIPVLVSIAARLQRHVLKLDVYQPYLVRYEAITQSIEEMVRSEDSVFGQFVRMQMQLCSCNTMSFSSLLLKPIQRLMKYPLFFKQLTELTPSTHPDHYASQALMDATDKIIRDMNDVKASEEDYNDLKHLQSRIKGLPAHFHLASRDRRLLRQGAVSCVQLSSKERTRLGLASDSLLTPRASSVIFPDTSSSSSSSSSSALQARNGSAVSLSPPSSLLDSERSLSSNGRGPRQSSPVGLGIFYPEPAEETFGGNCNSETVTEFGESDLLTSATSALTSTASNSSYSSSMSRRDNPKDSTPPAIHAFVFSDVVVLTTVDSTSTSKMRSSRSFKSNLGASRDRATWQDSYDMISGYGLARILKITDHSGKLPARPHLLELELLPLKNGTAMSASISGSKTLFLSFQTPCYDGVHLGLAPRGPEQEASLWLRALERSFVSSLRCLKRSSLLPSSYSLMSGRQVIPQRGSLRAEAHADWPRRVVKVRELIMAAARAGDSTNLASLIQSGLPFPKSPSQRELTDAAVEELRATHAQLYGTDSEMSGPTGEASHVSVVGFGVLDEVEEEREERRWWSLRLADIRLDADANREIDLMVKNLRDAESSSSSPSSYSPPSTSAGVSPDSSSSRFDSGQAAAALQRANGVRRKVRQGLPILRTTDSG